MSSYSVPGPGLGPQGHTSESHMTHDRRWHHRSWLSSPGASPLLPRPAPPSSRRRQPRGETYAGPQHSRAAGHRVLAAGPGVEAGEVGPGNWQPARAPSGAPAGRASSLTVTVSCSSSAVFSGLHWQEFLVTGQ